MTTLGTGELCALEYIELECKKVSHTPNDQKKSAFIERTLREAGMKVNDYYYTIQRADGSIDKQVYSWREVCEMRRQFDFKIVSKVLKQDYRKMAANK